MTGEAPAYIYSIRAGACGGYSTTQTQGVQGPTTRVQIDHIRPAQGKASRGQHTQRPMLSGNRNTRGARMRYKRLQGDRWAEAPSQTDDDLQPRREPPSSLSDSEPYQAPLCPELPTSDDHQMWPPATDSTLCRHNTCYATLVLSPPMSALRTRG